jgi:hypothetical protein
VDQKKHETFLAARRRFLPFKGVVGVGLGPKIKGGKNTGIEALIILVEKKLPRSEIPKGELIPEEFRGIRTDVRVPVLSKESNKRFDSNKVPEDGDEEFPDYMWIDDAKIHEQNLRERESRKKSSKKSGTSGRNAKGETRDEMDNPPTINVVGNLFLISDPDSTLVTGSGSSQTINFLGAYNLFRGTFGDHYDMITFYVDTASGLPNVGNSSRDIYNNVTGVGIGLINDRASWQNSNKLLRKIHHSWFNLRTLIHEPGHQWLFFVNYRETAGGTTKTLLHEDWPYTGQSAAQAFCHWGRWPDNDNSCMDYDRCDWIDNGNGTYNRVVHNEVTEPQYFGFCPMDLYLMGLIPSTDVPAVTVVQNPTPALPSSDSSGGPYTPSPSVATVSVAQVQNEEGSRSPDHLNSQRVFHQAIVVISKNTGTATSFMTQSETWRTDHTRNFRRATGSRAMIDTSLLRANFPDLYVRDNVTDTGSGTSTGMFWLSPDLWVRHSDEGMTPTEDNQCTIRNQSNYIYVKVHNRSNQAYENVTVNVYLANFATLVPATEFLYPVNWNPENDGLIGSALIPSVPPKTGGVDGYAYAKIEWTSSHIPPATGWHPCLLAEIIPMEIEPSKLHHVWDNRKLAQRNLTVIDPGGSCAPEGDMPQEVPDAFMFVYEFMIGHPSRQQRQTELHIAADPNFEGVELFLDPAGLVEGITDESVNIDATIPISPGNIPSGRNGVLKISPTQIVAEESPARLSGSTKCGTTLFVPAGTEIGVIPYCDSDVGPDTIALRFCNDTRIQIGSAGVSSLHRRYKMKGLQPVNLNGMPLLRVTDPENSAIVLNLDRGKTPILRLIGIVPSYKRKGVKSMCHITEIIDKKVIGGVSLQVNL